MLAQTVAGRRVGKDARRNLGKDTDTFERPHQAKETWGMGMGPASEALHGKRSLSKHIG